MRFLCGGRWFENVGKIHFYVEKDRENVGKTASLHAFNKFPTWLFY